MLGGAGYLYLGFTALPMPSHKEEQQKELEVKEQGLKGKEQGVLVKEQGLEVKEQGVMVKEQGLEVKEQGLEVKEQREGPGLLLLLLFLYYTASGAVERTFQSMATTW